MKKLLFLIAIAVFFTACEKELSQEGLTIQEPQPDPKPEPADTIVKFQLKAFYSDIPIDFDESDSEVKAETDLWNYVLDYIKDDYHILHDDGTLEIIQNSSRMPGLEDPVLYRTYSIGTDNAGEYIIYLMADYNPAKYRLHEISEDHFIIAMKWKDGARVFSRFERVK